MRRNSVSIGEAHDWDDLVSIHSCILIYKYIFVIPLAGTTTIDALFTIVPTTTVTSRRCAPIRARNTSALSLGCPHLVTRCATYSGPQPFVSMTPNPFSLLRFAQVQLSIFIYLLCVSILNYICAIRLYYSIYFYFVFL